MTRINLIVSICIGLVGLVISQETTIVSMMNDYYVMTPLKTFDEPKPTKMRLTNDKEIYFMIDDATYLFEIGKDSPRKLKYNVTFDSKRLLLDDSGNRISIEKNGMVHLKNEKTGTTLKLATEGRTAKQIAIDLNKKLAFVLTNSLEGSGRLYVFNTAKPNRLGGRVLPEFVDHFRSRVVSIYVDKSNGQILLTLTEADNKWSFQQLKPLQTIVCPPPPTVKDVNKKTLMAAINLAAEKIVEVYEDSIPGKSNYLQDELRKRKMIYPNAGSSRQSPTIDSGSEMEYVDPCTDEVKTLKAELAQEKMKSTGFQNNYNSLSELFQSNEFEVLDKKRNVQVPLNSKLPNAIAGSDANNYECVLKADLKKLQDAYVSTNEFLNNLIEVKNQQEGEPKLSLDVRFED